jgi:hypothetical protein
MNPRFDEISKAVGMTHVESNIFKKLAEDFAKESLHNKLPSIYTPDFVLPMLVYLVKNSIFVATLDEIALELNAYFAIRYPKDKPYCDDANDSQALFCVDLVNTFYKNYPHLILGPN